MGGKWQIRYFTLLIYKTTMCGWVQLTVAKMCVQGWWRFHAIVTHDEEKYWTRGELLDLNTLFAQ